ncbi:MAG: acetyl-CoA carboxylase biotin carboxylase subunit [Coriobacteriia bacterium]|nr:acetyl-CoA carboxylase biotin carboxylase subunit [Coriobacteriia bacterium]MCL2750703.1 acetyl-CoA carboxylase biotin carboxylase subunit [Coriobacteriia bacterium]
MFNKVLIANRGEIALRVVRALKELNVPSLMAYSEADAHTLAVLEADEAVKIGPAPSSQSYLSIPALIGAAVSRGADAIHPGYGFLAENAEFARQVANHGITWIGPSPESIEMMGNKSMARQTMQNAGVPTVPGSKGTIETLDDAVSFADAVGYPVLIKASAGGGGRGMREVMTPGDLEVAFSSARSEAQVAFGNSDVYLEKLVLRPRHIEFQVLADTHGNTIHLCERDCSVQRRHQKLIEEAPSPALTPELRERMGQAAIKAMEATNYVNAGTVEFLLDESNEFYFMEMNTRIQVEHPVTEMITLTDLIKEQVRIAAGEPISFMDKVPFTPLGHSIEFRLNAEDFEKNFMPSPGLVTALQWPGGPGVRIDSHLYAGYAVPPNYDSLVAKLVVWGSTREEALDRARRALSEVRIDGIKTTVGFHQKVLEIDAFAKGEARTDFVERYL